MNSVLWNALVSAEHSNSIPLNYEEAHPAFNEGFYSFKQQFGRGVNPHEEGTDSWCEWNDGFMTAYQNSLNYQDYPYYV